MILGIASIAQLNHSIRRVFSEAWRDLGERWFMNDRKVDDTILKQALEGVSINEKLYEKLLRHDIRLNGSIKPEGEVRVGWVKKLITQYGFESKQIDIEVPAGRIGRAAEAGFFDTVFADIVVYRDTQKTEPFVVIETKRPDEKTGLLQAESYARNLGAEYHIWHDGKHPVKIFLTSRFPNKSKAIGDIPRWIGKEPVISEIPKTVVLPPFRDENQMREVVHQCHELILEKQGHDPAKAFDELTKLLFLKLYDEREVPSVYKFMVLASEDQTDVAQKLRELFKEATKASKYKDVFQSKYIENIEVVLELDDFTIDQVVRLLQGYSLVNTTNNILGADIKGTVFEQMVGNTFRGELAQFFTPRELVHCIVDMIPPSQNSITLDPSCGSGGFLVMAIQSTSERLKQEYPNLSHTEINAKVRYFAENYIFGADINDRMARVAKMNMIMHGDGHAGVINTNGLLTEPNIPDRWRKKIRENSVSIIYSNPPFAGREKDRDILIQFELGKNSQDKPRSVSKEVLFVELIIKLLEPGGKAGLVLPSGIFNNPSMKDVRDYIKKNAKIIALVGLPHLAFQVSGANNEGHLLFLEKAETIPGDYNIFIDWANNVGIDTVGRKTGKNDLLEVPDRFRNPSPENIIRFSQLKDRIDPWHYHPKYSLMLNRLGRTKDQWVTFGEIFSLSEDKFNTADFGEESVLRYIEKGDVDVEKGQILSFSEHTTKTIPGRAKYILKENDVLFPDAYDSMRGIAIVPAKYSGYIATNRFFVVRHNPEKIFLEFAYHQFTKPEILALLKRECSGEINPGISWDALSQLEIPLPSIPEQEAIMKKIHEIQKKKEQLYNELASLDEEIEKQIRKVVPKVIVNYDDIKITRAEFIGEAKFKYDDKSSK